MSANDPNRIRQSPDQRETFSGFQAAYDFRALSINPHPGRQRLRLIFIIQGLKPVTKVSKQTAPGTVPLQRKDIALWSRRTRCLNLGSLSVIAGRIYFQVFDGLGITNSTRSLQTEFCLGAEILRGTHALA
jgi:hypothetical protein